MWEVNKPSPVKLIIGILAADRQCLAVATDALADEFGDFDLISDTWPFDQTDYYKDELGDSPLRQFLSVEKLIDPGQLANIKHKTNRIEPSKLVLASTKNFSHRVYIGNNMYAEVTLAFTKGTWAHHPYTFPDFKQGHYHDFFTKVRSKLMQQIKEQESIC